MPARRLRAKPCRIQRSSDPHSFKHSNTPSTGIDILRQIRLQGKYRATGQSTRTIHKQFLILALTTFAPAQTIADLSPQMREGLREITIRSDSPGASPGTPSTSQSCYSKQDIASGNAAMPTIESCELANYAPPRQHRHMADQTPGRERGDRQRSADL